MGLGRTGKPLSFREPLIFFREALRRGGQRRAVPLPCKASVAGKLGSPPRLPTLLWGPTPCPGSREKWVQVLQPHQLSGHGGFCGACQNQTVLCQAWRCGLTLGTERNQSNAICDILIMILRVTCESNFFIRTEYVLI